MDVTKILLPVSNFSKNIFYFGTLQIFVYARGPCARYVNEFLNGYKLDTMLRIFFINCISNTVVRIPNCSTLNRFKKKIIGHVGKCPLTPDK